MKNWTLAAVCAATLAFAGTASAAPSATRYVSPAGTDAGACTTTPCKTIGYALQDAATTGTIQVFAAQGETTAPLVTFCTVA